MGRTNSALNKNIRQMFVGWLAKVCYFFLDHPTKNILSHQNVPSNNTTFSHSKLSFENKNSNIAG